MKTSLRRTKKEVGRQEKTEEGNEDGRKNDRKNATTKGCPSNLLAWIE